MNVKPADPAAVIRDPNTKVQLPAEGAEVPENTFWTRRLLAGDVVRIDEPTPPIGHEPVSPLTTRAPRR